MYFLDLKDKHWREILFKGKKELIISRETSFIPMNANFNGVNIELEYAIVNIQTKQGHSYTFDNFGVCETPETNITENSEANQLKFLQINPELIYLQFAFDNEMISKFKKSYFNQVMRYRNFLNNSYNEQIKIHERNIQNFIQTSIDKNNQTTRKLIANEINEIKSIERLIKINQKIIANLERALSIHTDNNSVKE